MSKEEGLKEDFGSGEEGRLLDKAGEDWKVVCEGKVLSGIEGEQYYQGENVLNVLIVPVCDCFCILSLKKKKGYSYTKLSLKRRSSLVKCEYQVAN